MISVKKQKNMISTGFIDPYVLLSLSTFQLGGSVSFFTTSCGSTFAF